MSAGKCGTNTKKKPINPNPMRDGKNHKTNSSAAKPLTTKAATIVKNTIAYR